MSYEQTDSKNQINYDLPIKSVSETFSTDISGGLEKWTRKDLTEAEVRLHILINILESSFKNERRTKTRKNEGHNKG